MQPNAPEQDATNGEAPKAAYENVQAQDYGDEPPKSYESVRASAFGGKEPDDGEAKKQQKPEGESPSEPGDVPGGAQYGGDPDKPQGE